MLSSDCKVVSSTSDLLEFVKVFVAQFIAERNARKDGDSFNVNENKYVLALFLYVNGQWRPFYLVGDLSPESFGFEEGINSVFFVGVNQLEDGSFVPCTGLGCEFYILLNLPEGEDSDDFVRIVSCTNSDDSAYLTIANSGCLSDETEEHYGYAIRSDNGIVFEVVEGVFVLRNTDDVAKALKQCDWFSGVVVCDLNLFDVGESTSSQQSLLVAVCSENGIVYFVCNDEDLNFEGYVSLVQADGYVTVGECLRNDGGQYLSAIGCGDNSKINEKYYSISAKNEFGFGVLAVTT